MAGEDALFYLHKATTHFRRHGGSAADLGPLRTGDLVSVVETLSAPLAGSQRSRPNQAASSHAIRRPFKNSARCSGTRK
jgi:hypothetical protein